MNKFNKLSVLFFLLLAVFALPLNSQENEDKKRARISLVYTNVNMNGSRLTATVKSKLDRSYVNIPDVKVDFFYYLEDEYHSLGNQVTDKNGEATVIIPEFWRKIENKYFEFTFSASITDNHDFRDAEKEIIIKRSTANMALAVEDSSKIVRFYLAAPDSIEGEIPIEDAEARIYVQRMVGLLPISDEFETTNEEGILEIIFPDDIPGDKDGIITIIGKVDDHDDFGTLVFYKKINWGVPLETDTVNLAGELWSDRGNAPLSLVLAVNLILIGIWSILMYIVIQMIKISKLGKES
jgi:hypothetical protein